MKPIVTSTLAGLIGGLLGALAVAIWYQPLFAKEDPPILTVDTTRVLLDARNKLIRTILSGTKMPDGIDARVNRRLDEIAERLRQELHGHAVYLKDAVLAGQTQDITDQVIARLNAALIEDLAELSTLPPPPPGAVTTPSSPTSVGSTPPRS